MNRELILSRYPIWSLAKIPKTRLRHHLQVIDSTRHVREAGSVRKRVVFCGEAKGIV